MKIEVGNYYTYFTRSDIYCKIIDINGNIIAYKKYYPSGKIAIFSHNINKFKKFYKETKKHSSKLFKTINNT